MLWHTLAHAHKQEYDCMSMYVRYVAFAADATRRDGAMVREGEKDGEINKVNNLFTPSQH